MGFEWILDSYLEEHCQVETYPLLSVTTFMETALTVSMEQVPIKSILRLKFHFLQHLEYHWHWHLPNKVTDGTIFEKTCVNIEMV